MGVPGIYLRVVCVSVSASCTFESKVNLLRHTDSRLQVVRNGRQPQQTTTSTQPTFHAALSPGARQREKKMEGELMAG